MTPREARYLLAFRVVQGGLVAALLWKVLPLVAAAQVYYQMPLRQRFFPAFFESPTTFAVSYAVAVSAAAALIVIRGRCLRLGTAAAGFAALSILCLHQGSYNDATFTTAWWVMLWSLWFARGMGRGDAWLLHRGSRLSRAMLSVILLGGAAGKWTAEYWSGQVLYELYFVDRDYWLFNLLRAHFEPDMLREIATWYSRKVIVIETLGGLAMWAAPPRIGAAAGIIIFAAIALLSNVYLFSVVLSLIGLSAVGLMVRGAEGPGAGGPGGERAVQNEAQMPSENGYNCG